MTITSCNSITYWFHRLKSTQIHVPWRCLVASLNYLFMLSFVKTVKTISCSFNGMTWLLSLLTCKVQSEVMSSRSNKYQSDKVFGAVFYFEWMNTTSRKYKLLAFLNKVIYGQLFNCVFMFLDSFFCDCKQSAQ